MMHIWGTTRGMQPARDYLIIMSVSYNEMSMEEIFGTFAQMLKQLPPKDSYSDILQNNKLISLIENILDEFAEDIDWANFTIDVISRTYLSYIIFYIGLIADKQVDSEEKMRVLDRIYGKLDKKMVARLQYMNEEKMALLNNQVNSLLGEVGCVQYQKHFSELVMKSPYRLFSERQYSDDQLRKSIYETWTSNHFQEIENDTDNLLQVYSQITDDVESALWSIADRDGKDIIYTSVRRPNTSDVSKAIGFFFNFLNLLIDSVMNRQYGARDENIQKIENGLLRHLWNAFNKESSIWMLPSYNYELITKLVENER